jgi:hypothetical protein
MRNAEAARATACVSANRLLPKKKPAAARCASEPSGFASCAMRHAEVTKTASVRGGAVCLPDAIIPNSLSGHRSRSSAWPAFFLKSCCRCRRRAPKGAGVALNGIWAICIARTGYICSIAPNLLQLRGRSRMASRSTALDRRPIGGKLPVPLRYAEHLHYFYHFTGRSQSRKVFSVTGRVRLLRVGSLRTRRLLLKTEQLYMI